MLVSMVTAATCPPDTLPPTLRNQASVTPGGEVGYGQSVTLTCVVPGKEVFTRTRTCVYFNGSYLLQGADYECGRKQLFPNPCIVLSD